MESAKWAVGRRALREAVNHKAITLDHLRAEIRGEHHSLNK